MFGKPQAHADGDRNFNFIEIDIGIHLKMGKITHITTAPKW